MLPNKIVKNQIPNEVTSQRLDRLTVVDFNNIYSEYAGGDVGLLPRYPKYNPYLNNEAINASKQSGWQQAGNGFMQLGLRAANVFYTQVGQTFRNLQGKGDWNNVANVNATARDALIRNKYPIYKPQAVSDYEESNTGLLSSIQKYNPLVSPDFSYYWSETAANLGFTAGTIGYMAAEGFLLKKISPSLFSTTLPKRLQDSYKALYSLNKFDKARDAAYIANRNKLLLKTVGEAGFYTTRMLNLATGEGALEANMAANEFFYDQYLQSAGQGFADVADMEKIQDATVKVGNTTFGLNIGILTASNFITMGNIFKPSFLAKDTYKEAVKGLAKNQGKWYTKKELADTFMKKAGFYGLKAIKGTAKNINEGFEEVAQGISSRAAQNYYDTIEGDIGKSNFTFIEQLGREAVESFESGEGWDEFISGMITGMGIAGVKQTVESVTGQDKKQYQRQEQARDLLNTSIENYTAAFVESRNYKNLNEQTAISLETASQVAEGNQKAIKDLRTEARNSLFETMYKTGVGNEHIDFMFEGLQAMQQQDPNTVEQTVGERNLELEKEELKRQYKQWAKTADKNMTAFDSKNYSNRQAYERAIFDLTSMENHLQDTIARTENIKNELKDSVTNSPMALKLNDMMEALADPQKFDQLIANQQEFVNAQEESLKTLEVSEEERKQHTKELNEEKEYLSILKDTRDRIVDQDGNIKENFNSDSTVSRLIQSFNRLDQANFNSRVQPELRDLLTLSVESSNLQKTINILSNEKYFSKYAEAHAKVQEAYRNKIFNRFKNQGQTEETKPAVEDAVKRTGVSLEQEKEAEGVLANIELEEGKFTYDNEAYDTYEEAFEAALKDVPDAVKKQPEVISELKKAVKDSLLGVKAGSQQTTLASNRSVVPQKIEEQWKKDQDITKVPDDVLDEIYTQKPNPNDRTEIEKQMTIADKERGEESYLRRKITKIEESEKEDDKPKTKEDVSDSYTTKPETNTATLAHFFSFAHAAINTIGEYLSKNNKINIDPKIDKVLTPIRDLNTKPDFSVTTIYMNDTIITDNVRDSKDVTTEQVLQDLEENDSAVIRDNRGRLVIVTTDRNLNNTKEKLAELYDLYVNVNDRGKLTTLRIRSYDGEIVPASFEQDTFDSDSVKQINKVGRKDRVEVVIPYTEYNKNLILEYQRQVTDGMSRDDMKKVFNSLVADEIVLDFVSEGITVGRMRSGSYFVEDSKASKKISDFRKKMLTFEDFIEFTGSDSPIVLGTVEAHTAATQRNIERDEQGNPVFTTLEEYENSLKENPDLNVKVEYFVATSRNNMEDKNGKRVGISQINRKQPLRTGAVYVRLIDSEGNYLVLQAARDDARRYSTEDLKQDTFKQELEVNLKRGENPVVSKRLYINRATFDANQPQGSHIEKITPELKKADGNNATLVVGSQQKELTNIEVDEETQNVYGTNKDGIREQVDFRSISQVNGVESSQTLSKKEQRKKEVERISKLPFEERIPELIKAGIIASPVTFNLGKRFPVIVNIAGVRVAFYRSSEGTGGKKKGSWTPMFGFGESSNGDMWLIKGDIDTQVNQNYNSEAIAEYAEILNKTLNWEHSLDKGQVKDHPYFKELTLVDSAEAFNKELYGVGNLGIKNGQPNVMSYIKSRLDEINTNYSEETSIVPETETTEQEEIVEVPYEEVSPLLKEQWILTNGEAGKTYSLPDGTKIKVIGRTDNEITLQRASQTVTLPLGDQEVVDFVTLRDQVASEKISDAELYEILESQENGLSLRQKIVKIFHAGRLAGLSGKIEASNKLIGRTLSDFVSQSTIDMLELLIPSGMSGLTAKLVEAYRQGVVNKNTPQSMEELLERAQIPQEQRQALRDMMTYLEFASFFAYISQADTIYGFQKMNVVRYGMQSEVETLKRELEFIEAMDFEATPQDKREEKLQRVANQIVKVFGRQSMFIEGLGKTPDGFITLEDKPSNIEVLSTLINMFESSYGLSDAKDIAKNFIEANDKLVEHGIKIHLDSLFTTEYNEQRTGMGRDVVLNDSKDFMEEFNDLAMSKKAVDAINNNRPFLVKDEKGLTVEFFAKDLPAVDTERVASTTDLINEELRPYGLEISREYVAAYLSVNEDSFQMYDRIVNRKIDLEEVLDYTMDRARQNTSQVKTEYFNKTKAARQAEQKMCS